MKVFLHIIGVVLFVGYSVCETDDLQENFDAFLKSIRRIDAEYEANKKRLESGTNYHNFNENDELELPLFLEKAISEKCERNGAGDDALDKWVMDAKNVKRCVATHINPADSEEIQIAIQTGSLGEVFGKYCKKWPSVYKCLDNRLSIMKSCLDENEKKTFNIILDIISDLQEYLCFKDGERLTLFYIKGGVECLVKQQQGLVNCQNSILSRKMSGLNNPPSNYQLPALEFSSSNCEDVEEFRICSNTELGKCQDKTPADIIEGFLKIIQKRMSCNSATRSGGWSLITVSGLLLVSFLIRLKMY